MPLLRSFSCVPLLAAGLVAQATSPVTDAFVRAHCVECHGGDSTKGKLDLTKPATGAVEQLWRLQRLRDRLRAGEMPPPDAPRPPQAEAQACMAAIDAELARAVPQLPPDPGRVTVRRLSRAHWENAVRDLFGVAVSTAAFPADDLGYGFDSIGDALSMSAIHLEHWLVAARSTAEAVFDGEDPAQPTVRRCEAESMQVLDGANVSLDGDVPNLIVSATIAQQVRLPRDGSYRLRVLAGGDQAGDEPVKMVLRLDGRDLETIDVPERRLRTFELKTPLPGGEHTFAIAFVNDYYDKDHPDPQRRDRNLRVDWLEVEGPLEPRVVPEAQRWLHAAVPAKGDAQVRLLAMAKALLPRVWRRVVGDDECNRLARAGAALLQQGQPFVAAQRLLLQAALASPHFVFRVETGGIEGSRGAVVPISSHGLAARLAFFLWASTPDHRLLELARAGSLASPAVLAAEVDRLLADPRADSLATDFCSQWLELKNLGDRTPDPARFPGFDDELRRSLRTETELLFRAVLRDQLPVQGLLDADFTHVDAVLAQHYGLPVPTGSGFLRVTLPPERQERGGLLGHGSVHAVTSNPTRTSPVKRGKWMLENLLDAAPPAPPPGNDSFANEAAIDSTASLRAQLMQHRERSACAVCHTRMDALGFALERYDAVGRHRAADAAGPIDCKGQLPDGTEVDGLAALKRVLAADPAFVRTLTHKLFLYAIGRELRPVDRLRLDHRVEELLRSGPVTLRDLIGVVVADIAFTSRTVVAPK